MESLKFSWEKVTPKENYLVIGNKLITDLCSNPNALALLLLMLSNKSGYFNKKEEICEKLGWNKTNKVIWKNAIEFLKQKGYASVIGNGAGIRYTFSNIVKFDCIAPKVSTKVPKRPSNCSFTEEEWFCIYASEDEIKEYYAKKELQSTLSEEAIEMIEEEYKARMEASNEVIKEIEQVASIKKEMTFEEQYAENNRLYEESQKSII